MNKQSCVLIACLAALTLPPAVLCLQTSSLRTCSLDPTQPQLADQVLQVLAQHA